MEINFETAFKLMLEGKVCTFKGKKYKFNDERNKLLVEDFYFPACGSIGFDEDEECQKHQDLWKESRAELNDLLQGKWGLELN